MRSRAVGGLLAVLVAVLLLIPDKHPIRIHAPGGLASSTPEISTLASSRHTPATPAALLLSEMDARLRSAPHSVQSAADADGVVGRCEVWPLLQDLSTAQLGARYARRGPPLMLADAFTQVRADPGSGTHAWSGSHATARWRPVPRGGGELRRRLAAHRHFRLQRQGGAACPCTRELRLWGWRRSLSLTIRV